MVGRIYTIHWLGSVTSCPVCGSMLKTGHIPKDFIRCVECESIFQKLNYVSEYADSDLLYQRVQ